MKKIMFNEVWKDIVGFEGLYEVSNYGRVRRSDTKRLKETPLNNYGYPQVNLHKNGKSHLRRIHRLVAIAFVDNPYPIKYDCINHKDENPCNNNAYNLEWCDRAYNNNYGGRNARSAISHSKAVMQYTLDGEFLKEWCSGTDASRHLSIPQAAINACCLHKPKYNQAGGFLWKFKDDSTPVAFKQGKRVAKYRVDGTLVEEYQNITEASKTNHILPSSISNCLAGRSILAGGYKWKLIK